MHEELIDFVQSLDRDSYLAFREKVIALDSYEPYSDELDTAAELCEQGKWEDARDLVQNAMGHLILSSRAHRVLSFLHHKLGDDQAAQFESMIAHCCLIGILATGDGSVDDPFIVVRTSDEHDLIEHLGKQLEQQSLMHQGDRHLDVIKCIDGTEYWFDITVAYNQLSKS